MQLLKAVASLSERFIASRGPLHPFSPFGAPWRLAVFAGDRDRIQLPARTKLAVAPDVGVSPVKKTLSPALSFIKLPIRVGALLMSFSPFATSYLLSSSYAGNRMRRGGRGILRLPNIDIYYFAYTHKHEYFTILSPAARRFNLRTVSHNGHCRWRLPSRTVSVATVLRCRRRGRRRRRGIQGDCRRHRLARHQSPIGRSSAPVHRLAGRRRPPPRDGVQRGRRFLRERVGAEAERAGVGAVAVAAHREGGEVVEWGAAGVPTSAGATGKEPAALAVRAFPELFLELLLF